MKIAFFGTPEFAADILTAIENSNHEVVGVVTQPDRPAGRGGHLKASAVKEKALLLQKSLLQPESLKDEAFLESLALWQADIFVVVAFSILPKVVLGIPALGSVNLHGSLLPFYRGAAPIQWAVANGETQTGYTIFQLDEKMDHGPIILKETLEISLSDTSEDVFLNMSEKGCAGMLKALDLIESKQVNPLPQNHSLATPARKLKKEDGYWQPHWTAIQCYNHFRGFYPWPGITAQWNGKSFKLTQMKLAPTQNKVGESGDLHFDGSQLFLKCADAWIELIEVQPENKKSMTALEWKNGLQNSVVMPLKVLG